MGRDLQLLADVVEAYIEHEEAGGVRLRPEIGLFAPFWVRCTPLRRVGMARSGSAAMT